MHKVRYLMSSLVFLMILLCSLGSLSCFQGDTSNEDSGKKGSEAATANDKQAAESPEKHATSSQVTVYVTSWCPACKMTIDFLKREGIPHTVKDIEKNSAFLDEMVKKAGGNRGVPVIDVNGKILLGFNPYLIKELLR